MPSLTWASKASPKIPSVSLELDSIIYPHGAGYPSESVKNQLILGDNLRVMSALLPNYANKVNLIYADPPFFTNKHYPARIGRGEDSRKPKEWQLAEGYPDHWISLDAYLDMLYPRLRLMHQLLSPTGTLYLHLDWHASAYARLILDEIFGAERLLNEIVWVYHGPSPIRSAFNRKHDTILVYTKSEKYTFNVDAVRLPYNPVTIRTFASSPKAGFGKIPDLKRGKVPEDWWYFPVVARLHSERSGYPTQKPEALLQRMILASSNPGDIIADFFCGSGTTGVVAARHGRHFLLSDVSSRAIHTTRIRLVTGGAPAFSMQFLAGMECNPYDGTRNSAVVLKKAGNHVSLQSEDLEAIDYWEIDPDWNGRIFLSAAQAIRPRRTRAIPTQVELPRSAENAKICARIIDIQGNALQLELV